MHGTSFLVKPSLRTILANSNLHIYLQKIHTLSLSLVEKRN